MLYRSAGLKSDRLLACANQRAKQCQIRRALTGCHSAAFVVSTDRKRWQPPHRFK
jgi:LRP1 type putative zinc finger protein